MKRKRISRLQVTWKILVISSLLINSLQGYQKVTAYIASQPFYKRFAIRTFGIGLLARADNAWGGR